MLATPWPATEAAVKGLGNLAGKTSSIAPIRSAWARPGSQLVLGHTTSAGEQVAAWAPGASVFKTLNQIGADSMDKAALFPVQPVMFVAGDDESEKPLVLKLVASLGFAAVDAGPLRIARLLEPYGMLWIDQALNRGRGLSFAFATTERAR